MQVSDNFNRGDGPLGANWGVSGSIAIASAAAVLSTSPNFYNLAGWVPNSFADQFSQATIRGTDGEVGLFGRCQSSGLPPAAYGVWLISSSGLAQFNVLAVASLNTVPITNVNGSVFRLEVIGQGFGNIYMNLYQNGLLIGVSEMIQSWTGTELNSGTPGFGFVNVDPSPQNYSLDDWSGGDLVADSVTEQLAYQLRIG